MVRTHDSRDTEETTDRLIQYSNTSFDTEGYEEVMTVTTIRVRKGKSTVANEEHPEENYLEMSYDLKGLEELVDLFW